LAHYVLARAYSLEQHNAGQAHAGLCHASSWRLNDPFSSERRAEATAAAKIANAFD